MFQDSNSGDDQSPKTSSLLRKHRNSSLIEISKRKREAHLQGKRLQNLERFLLQSPCDKSFSPIDPERFQGEEDYLNSVGDVVKVLVHLIAGEKSQAEKTIEETPYLQKLLRLIEHDEVEDMRRKACLILSEIVLKNDKASQVLVDDEESLMKILRAIKDNFIEEGMWVLVNLTRNINFGRIKKLVEQGVLDCFVEILDGDDAEIVGLGLEGITNVLECGEMMANCQGERRNLFVEELKMNGGVGKIDDLQWSENEEIHRKAERILDEFFAEDEEQEFGDYEIEIENE